MRLYHYAPKVNTVMECGLLSISKSPRDLRAYAHRAGSENRDEIMAWFDKTFAGLVVNNLIKAYDKWDEEGEFKIQEDFDDLYIDMLSNTGVEDFKSLLEPFGIDADSPDFWSNCLSLITDYINEIEKLAKREGLL